MIFVLLSKYSYHYKVDGWIGSDFRNIFLSFFLLLFSRFNIFFLIIAGVAWAEKDLSKGNEEAV